MPEESPTPLTPARPPFSRRLRLPAVSGKWTVIWLLVCAAVSGLLIPLILRKPLWVEFELVVAVWWLLSGMLLTKLLYRGERVADDHRQHSPRDWFNLKHAGTSDLSGCGPGIDGEGCLVLVGLLIALLLVWLLIELLIPVVFFLLYFLIRGMLVHAAHNRPRCRGHLSMSVGCGFFWATIYTTPLAGVVWLVHVIGSRG